MSMTTIKMRDLMMQDGDPGEGSDEELDEEEEDCYSEDDEYCRSLLREHYGSDRRGGGASLLDALTPLESNYYQQPSSSAAAQTMIPIATPPPTRRKKYPKEMKKTLLAFLFMLGNFIATTVSLSIIHERRPLVDPLPDAILDTIAHQKWALDVSEIILQIMTFSTIVLVLFHKYRMIVLRRMFFILGLLYGYRAITMFVTVLPSANPSYHCAPKLVDSGRVLTVREVVKRVFKILSGFGLSINGKHVYCGDYIYSGHTMIAVLCYLVIVEYTDRRWYIFHYLVWLLAVTAVCMLMLARGHYSIDVIIAYFITTRLFWLYHSIAYFDSLKRSSSSSYLRTHPSFNRFEKLWWWRFLAYFEKNVHSGPLPNIYNTPFVRPKWMLGYCRRISSSSSSH